MIRYNNKGIVSPCKIVVGGKTIFECKKDLTLTQAVGSVQPCPKVVFLEKFKERWAYKIPGSWPKDWANALSSPKENPIEWIRPKEMDTAPYWDKYVWIALFENNYPHSLRWDYSEDFIPNTENINCSGPWVLEEIPFQFHSAGHLKPMDVVSVDERTVDGVNKLGREYLADVRGSCRRCHGDLSFNQPYVDPDKNDKEAQQILERLRTDASVAIVISMAGSNAKPTPTKT